MGWFRKKDPLAEKERQIRQQIAALEARIRELSEHPEQTLSASGAPPVPPPAPRLRSTTFPHGPTVPGSPPPTTPPSEPVFEEVNPFKAPPEPPLTDPAAELGVKRSGWAAWWERLSAYWRGPATSNPKLVNYLAAGSIQGLRPLRYEKRVARNRFIVLVVLLILVLLGFFSVFFHH